MGMFNMYCLLYIKSNKYTFLFKMVRTTNKKENYLPVNKKNENLYVISWDFQDVVEHVFEEDPETGRPRPTGETRETNLGNWMIEMFHYRPTFNYVQNMILKWYNEQVDRKILNGFKWTDAEGNEFPVWLSTENQFNYKAAYDLAVQTQGASLPVQFKFGTTHDPVYHTFETLEDLSNFYISAMTYINNTLSEGWQKKDNIDWSVYESLKSHV